MLESFTWEIAYVGGVGALGLLSLLLLRRRLRRQEAVAKSRLEQVRRFDAVRTETPLEHPAQEARARGLANLESRSALIRRVLIPAGFLLWALLLALPFVGRVPATLMTLFAGVISVMVGIAARPFVENLIAGIVISLTQPLRIGDTVKIDGEFGTVEDVTSTHTRIKAWDWRRYLIPNVRLLEKEFVNYSIVDRYQWAYVEFWVEPEADLERVQALAIAAVKTSASFVAYEEPRFWVMEAGKEGLRCWIAGWADTPSSAWALCHDTRMALMKALREAEIKSHSHAVSLQGAPA
ncbi:MAG: mechanosensitive ion channel [Planctomycetota bacterium]